MRLQKILYNSQNNFKISENKIKIAHNEKTDKNYLKWTENNVKRPKYYQSVETIVI